VSKTVTDSDFQICLKNNSCCNIKACVENKDYFSGKYGGGIMDGPLKKIAICALSILIVFFIAGYTLAEEVYFADATPGSSTHLNHVSLFIDGTDTSTVRLRAEVPAGKRLKAYNLFWNYDSTIIGNIQTAAVAGSSFPPGNINNDSANQRIVINGFNISGVSGPTTIDLIDITFNGNGKGCHNSTITVNSFGSGSADQFPPTPDDIKICTTAVPTQFSFTNETLSQSAGDIGAMAVQLQDEDGDPANAHEIFTVYLTSDSPRGVFYNAAGDTVITSVNIPQGSAYASFQYYDETKGAPTITAAHASYSNAVQQQTISAGPLTQMKVFPQNVTLSKTDLQQFFIAGKDDFENEVSNFGVINWEITGGIGSIDTAGVFTAQAIGTGAVRATSSINNIEALSGDIDVTCCDINSDNKVDLKDLVLGLKVVTNTGDANYSMPSLSVPVIKIMNTEAHYNMDTSNNVWFNTGDMAIISADKLVQALNNGHIKIETRNQNGLGTEGDIIVASSINLDSINAANILTLSANKNITINGEINANKNGVDLNTLYTSGNIIINETVSSVSGPINIQSSGLVSMGADAIVEAGAPITITAYDDISISTIKITADSNINDITIVSFEGSIVAGIINAGTLGDVTLAAPAGPIRDAAGKIIGDQLTADAAGAITLNTTVNTIDASTVAPGGIQINETDDVDLRDVDNVIGPISVMAYGNLTATDVQVSAGDMHLSANNILLGNVFSAGGTVYLTAGGSIDNGTFTGSYAAINAGTIGLNTAPVANVSSLSLILSDEVEGRSGELLGGAALVMRPPDFNIMAPGTVQISGPLGSWDYLSVEVDIEMIPNDLEN